MNENKKDWVLDNSYLNREVINGDVFRYDWSKNRKIYVHNNKNVFQYIFSCGANSDYSFSGSFYMTNIRTIEQAKERLLLIAKAWFSNDMETFNKLKN